MGTNEESIETIDITKITDVKELKSLAYDQMTVLETAQNNLRMINQRLAQIAQEDDRAKPDEEKKK